VFKAIDGDLAKLGGTAMMTEGMACPDANQDECVFVMDLADKHLMSFTDYGHSQGDDFDLSDVQKQTWARTYARAIAGTPLSMSFDAAGDDRKFSFCYSLDATIDKETEVFASRKYNYPAGAKVEVEGNAQQVDSGDPDLLWFVKLEEAKTGDEVCITVSA
jgi:hypothetical protein